MPEYSGILQANGTGEYHVVVVYEEEGNFICGEAEPWPEVIKHIGNPRTIRKADAPLGNALLYKKGEWDTIFLCTSESGGILLFNYEVKFSNSEAAARFFMDCLGEKRACTDGSASV